MGLCSAAPPSLSQHLLSLCLALCTSTDPQTRCALRDALGGPLQIPPALWAEAVGFGKLRRVFLKKAGKTPLLPWACQAPLPQANLTALSTTTHGAWRCQCLCLPPPERTCPPQPNQPCSLPQQPPRPGPTPPSQESQGSIPGVPSPSPPSAAPAARPPPCRGAPKFPFPSPFFAGGSIKPGGRRTPCSVGQAGIPLAQVLYPTGGLRFLVMGRGGCPPSMCPSVRPQGDTPVPGRTGGRGPEPSSLSPGRGRDGAGVSPRGRPGALHPPPAAGRQRCPGPGAGGLPGGGGGGTGTGHRGLGAPRRGEWSQRVKKNRS